MHIHKNKIMIDAYVFNYHNNIATRPTLLRDANRTYKTICISSLAQYFCSSQICQYAIKITGLSYDLDLR